MNNPKSIILQAPFKIPNGYRREFILNGDGGFTFKILFDKNGATISSDRAEGFCQDPLKTWDWICESIAIARKEIETSQ